MAWSRPVAGPGGRGATDVGQRGEEIDVERAPLLALIGRELAASGRASTA